MPTNQTPNLNDIRRMFSSTVCSADFVWDTDESSAVTTKADGVHLGDVGVHEYRGKFCKAIRSKTHITLNPADSFLIVFTRPESTFKIAQFTSEVLVKPENFVLLTTLEPFESINAKSSGSTQSNLALKVPGPLLRQLVPNIDNCCGIPMPARDGSSKVLRALAETILVEGPTLSNAQAQMFGSMLVNWTGIVMLDSRIQDSKGALVSRQQLAYARVRLRAKDYIERNLPNPMLAPAMVADHCHVTVRYLHSAFESSSTTVATLIRDTRLQRCKADLLNPALRYRTISQIATKWGFSSPEIFARSYRVCFGKSPREERRLSLLEPIKYGM